MFSYVQNTACQVLSRYVFDKTDKLLKTEAATLTLDGVEEGRITHRYTFPMQDFSGFKLIISRMGLRSLYDHVLAGEWPNGRTCYSMTNKCMYTYGSLLGPGFSGFSMWYFLKLILRDFLCVL